ncbi:hypothetical protein Thermo_00115 [Thermoplasmatales archaeon]|nr:hypothetical protein Thermo_00115 [Thermoplasmatales archaeon]
MILHPAKICFYIHSRKLINLNITVITQSLSIVKVTKHNSLLMRHYNVM